MAANGVWAIGDVTGIMPFTHVAKYQGRIVADAILGQRRAASYDGIPRVVFADPEIAAVSLTQDQAGQQGLRTASAELDLASALARPWTYEREPRAHLGLLADRDQRVLIGAWAVAPQAGEWIYEASLAIRARIPSTCSSTRWPNFPTYSEGYLQALEELGLSGIPTGSTGTSCRTCRAWCSVQRRGRLRTQVNEHLGAQKHRDPWALA